MTTLKKLLATTAMSTFLVMPAFAQDMPATDDPVEAPADMPETTTDPMADPLDAPAADPMADPMGDPMVDDGMGADTGADMGMQSAPVDGTVTADDVIGADLLGFDGDVIASVDDVVLDTAGSIEAILVDVGGFLGLGATTKAIPFEDVSVEADDSGNTVLRSQLTASDLEAMPEYEESN